MRVISVPAKYAPEIEKALGFLMTQIEGDIKLRELGSETGTYVDIDESRTGRLVVLVGVSLAVEGLSP